MSNNILKKTGVFFLFGITTLLWGAEPRAVPIDMYIIVDGSSAMERGKQEATAWLCSTVVDGILQQGDRLWIWTAGDRPQLIYSGAVETGKESAKTSIRSIQFQGDRADYQAALREVRATLTAQNGKRLSCTLLISGSGAKDTPSREAESAGLLRYSRVESFSGWRVLTVGLDLQGKVRQSSSYYMKNR
ncbi:MAG: VWA domain-containing protein [Treponema sp.]|jgi:hypothetical protein|nr:VWA domain-containing protein [Treponema sp.]